MSLKYKNMSNEVLKNLSKSNNMQKILEFINKLSHHDINYQYQINSYVDLNFITSMIDFCLNEESKNIILNLTNGSSKFVIVWDKIEKKYYIEYDYYKNEKVKNA